MSGGVQGGLSAKKRGFEHRKAGLTNGQLRGEEFIEKMAHLKRTKATEREKPKRTS